MNDPASQESLNPLKSLVPVSPLLEVDVSFCNRKGEGFHCVPRAQNCSPFSSAGLASLMVAGVKRVGEGRDSLTENPHCLAIGCLTCSVDSVPDSKQYDSLRQS